MDLSFLVLLQEALYVTLPVACSMFGLTRPPYDPATWINGEGIGELYCTVPHRTVLHRLHACTGDAGTGGTHLPGA